MRRDRYMEGFKIQACSHHTPGTVQLLSSLLHRQHRILLNVIRISSSLPKLGGHQAHDDAHGPDANYQQHNPALRHGAVQLHGENSLVALDGHGQQVGHRGRQADVDEGVADVPLLLSEGPSPGARVQHQVGIGDASKQVRCSHVGQEIVDGKVEATVHEDGHHHQQVGQDNNEAHRQAQSNHDAVPRRPSFTDFLAHSVIEEDCSDMTPVQTSKTPSAAFSGVAKRGDATPGRRLRITVTQISCTAPAVTFQSLLFSKQVLLKDSH
ncbi:hypothetical protein INR49_011045 [Caranx melampygus]|nr:hypothetical protein INR49_011045 [Caranx melampygus]